MAPTTPDYLAGHDATQVELLKETIVVVDQDDRVLGYDSKENCTCRACPAHACTQAPPPA